MFAADMAVVQTFGLVGGVGEHAFCLVAQGQVNPGRSSFSWLYARGYIPARGFVIHFQQNVAHEFLILAKQSEEEVFGLDQRRAALAGLVAGEEDLPDGLFLCTAQT